MSSELILKADSESAFKQKCAVYFELPEYEIVFCGQALLLTGLRQLCYSVVRHHNEFELHKKSGRQLRLTIKREYFEAIASGNKTTEYRQVKPYWTRIFESIASNYSSILFVNGYSPNSPRFEKKLKAITLQEASISFFGAAPKLLYHLYLEN